MKIKFLLGIKAFKRDEQGLVSPMALVLVLICVAAVTYVLQLEKEHHINWKFAMDKIKMQNMMISQANENRHQLYEYYQGGEVLAYPQNRLVELVPEVLNPHNKEVIHFPLWRRYDKYYKAEGGRWCFIMANENIMPKVYWSYEVEQGKVVRSRWNKY